MEHLLAAVVPDRPPKTDSPYSIWQRAEGIPILRGSSVDDLHKVDVAPWPRLGQKGAFVNLADQEEDDGWVIEVEPGGSTRVLHHAFEMSIYVVDGRGATSLWQDETRKQTVEWQRGSIFSPPLNCSYQHFNLDGQRPARLFAVTNAPMVMNLYRCEDFAFNNPYVFKDRYAGQDSYFTGPGEMVAQTRWQTNFVPDVRAVKLAPARRGLGATTMEFSLCNNLSIAHSSEFPAGTYKLAHRHNVGAHVIILEGVGYSLLWFEGETERRRVNWTDGTVLSPREGEYHQHFNTGPSPARYMAFRLGDLDRRKGWGETEDGYSGIPYYREDPAIYDLYLSECAKSGAQVVLPRPDYR
ncbi:MAG: Gentisate 1,2-dioxygenase [Chloroflexi bacterium]|nr:Gentisate 1,2-dioxygenase [Chloroflexota bacterium]